MPSGHHALRRGGTSKPLRLLPVGSTLVSKRSLTRSGGPRPWATTRATCATSSSTSSRSSAVRRLLGTGPYEVDQDTAREILQEVAPPGRERAGRVLLGLRPQPAGLRPGRPRLGDDARVVHASRSTPTSTAASGPSTCPPSSAAPSLPPSLRWAVDEMLLGSNPAVRMFAACYGFAKLLYALGNDDQKKLAHWIVEKGWHCTMVLTEPDAGSDVGAGRTKATAERRRHLDTSPASSASSPAPSPTWSTTSCTSSSPVPRAPAPAPRACRSSSSPSSHVDLETGELGERNGVYVTNVEKKMGLKVSTTCELTFGGERARRRHPARRRPRRHRADVPRHRERPDDGRHQGDRHPVDRLPQRARLRQAARPGRRPDPDDRQDRAARHHHPPPRRAPFADDPEGVLPRACAPWCIYTACQQDIVDQAQLGSGLESSSRAPPPTSPAGSTTCCCRSSRAWAPSAPGCCWAPSRCRPSAAPASCRTTRSSSTCATPRSTPSTRAPRPSRAWTSSSARSSRDKGQALTHLATQMQEFAKDLGAPRRPPRPRPRAARAGPRGRPGHPRLHGRRADEVRPAQRRRDHQPLHRRPEHLPPAARRR